MFKYLFQNVFGNQSQSKSEKRDQSQGRCCIPSSFLPKLEDFKEKPHAKSSRILNITLEEEYWKFVNCRGDVCLRSLSNPPTWFFLNQGCPFQLCCHQAPIIESIYGQFINKHCDPDKDWIFDGYLQDVSKNIYFYGPDYGDKLKTRSSASEEHGAFGGSQKVSDPSNVPVQTSTTAQVFIKIQRLVREKYLTLPTYHVKFPLKVNVLDFTICDLFNVSTKSWKASSNEMKSSAERIFLPFQAPNNRILVQGSPGFGKSTFTYILAHQWAHGVSEIRDFKICLQLNLLALSFEDHVTQGILQAVVKWFKKVAYSTDTVGRTLAENSEKIVLLLDGYDLLPEDHQHKLLLFLASSAVFKRSSILMTTRPIADQYALKLFTKQVSIRGFSKSYLQKHLLLDKCGHTIKDLCENVSESQLHHLSTLSPYFTCFAYRALHNGLNSRSLYSILDYTIQAVIAGNMASGSVEPSATSLLIRKLAHLSFCAVIKGKAYFPLELLEKTFGQEFGFLSKSNIFYAEDRKRRKWIISSKLLAVFLATMYLRNEWDNLQNDQMRKDFLKNVFCRGGCKGDYIQGEESFYYVGLIPEVVLKFGDNHSLESANFEMYHDVERIEHSTAFDSVNLLSRISGKFLSRFGFRTISESDDRVLTSFGWIFNTKTLSKYTVDNSFYTNDYEQKQFLAIDVKRDDDVVLQTVLRAKTAQTVDRIYIDFAYCVLKDVFSFIRSMLSRYLGGLELPDDIETMSPTFFVFNLVWLICGCLGERSATIVCQNSNSESSKILATLKMCWDRETKQAVVCVFDSKFQCTEYRKDEFSNADTQLKVLLGKSHEFTSDLRVSINLFQSW